MKKLKLGTCLVRGHTENGQQHMGSSWSILGQLISVQQMGVSDTSEVNCLNIILCNVSVSVADVILDKKT